MRRVLFVLTGLGRIFLLLLLYLFIYKWVKAMGANPLFAEESVQGSSVRLVWLQGPDVPAYLHQEGRRLVLEKEQEIEVRLPAGVGRDMGNAIQINDPYISAFHARIFQEGRNVFLSDLASRNGTWRNDALICHPVCLQPGDRIRCGESVLVFKG